MQWVGWQPGWTAQFLQGDPAQADDGYTGWLRSSTERTLIVVKDIIIDAIATAHAETIAQIRERIREIVTTTYHCERGQPIIRLEATVSYSSRAVAQLFEIVDAGEKKPNGQGSSTG